MMESEDDEDDDELGTLHQLASQLADDAADASARGFVNSATDDVQRDAHITRVHSQEALAVELLDRSIARSGAEMGERRRAHLVEEMRKHGYLSVDLLSTVFSFRCTRQQFVECLAPLAPAGLAMAIERTLREDEDRRARIPSPSVAMCRPSAARLV